MEEEPAKKSSKCVYCGHYKDDKCDLYKSRPQKEKTVTVEHLDIAIKDLEELVQIFYKCDY